jgi:hypothetical protein
MPEIEVVALWAEVELDGVTCLPIVRAIFHLKVVKA